LKSLRIAYPRSLNLKYLGKEKILSVILVAAIIASSTTLIYIVVIPKPGEVFTEFYLLGSNGTASEYPTDLTVGEDGKVIIFIVNYEYENVTYRLEVNFNGSLIHAEQVFLIENEKWESPFKFKATKKGINQKLEFILYKDHETKAYRTLHLYVSVI